MKKNKIMARSKFIEKILSREELEKIATEIGNQEKTTSGEIRVSIKKQRSFFERKKSLRDIAIKEFNRLKMFRTRDRNGILLLLLLKERQFYILPDYGISNVLPQSFWDNIARETEDFFRKEKFFDGIINMVQKCGKILSEHFPIKSDDTNELDNKVEIS